MKRFFDGVLSRRSLFRSAGVAGAATAMAAGAAGCAKKQPAKLAIVHTNDTHGHDLLDEESLGFAAAAQLRTDYEAKGYEVLLLDAGDFAQGDFLVNCSKGETAIDFMNVTGYQAACLGNHEFDFGQDILQGYVEQAEYPLLSCNIFVDATGDLLVEPRTTLTLANGTKVGIVGVTTPATRTTTNPLFTRGLTFLDGADLYAAVQEQVDALRAEGCELVVCLAHLGESESSAPDRAQDLVANTTGLDLVVDGHDHEEENQLIKNASGEDVLVVETGCYTHSVGVVTWEDGTLAAQLMAFGSYEGQDEAVAAHIQQVSDDLHVELGELIATSEYVLDGERSPGIRTHETNLGDLVADAVLWEAQQMADDVPDCAIVNGGGIRMSLQPGDITMGDVLNVLPFTNYVCTIQVSGAQLLEALEASCFATPEEVGAFPQVSGMSFTVDARKAFEAGETYPGSTFMAPANPGGRVTIHDVGGRGFDLEDTYTIASNDFMCAGGDTYYVFADAATTTMKTIGYLQSDCLRYYLQEACGGVVPEEYADPAGQGRMEVIL